MDLQNKPDGVSLHDYVSSSAKTFYGSLLNLKNELDPKAPAELHVCPRLLSAQAAQRRTSLKEVAPVVLADMLTRIATSSDLPADGHAVHSTVQGLAKFLWNGPASAPKTCRAVLESESTWDVGSSRLAQAPCLQSGLGFAARCWGVTLSDPRFLSGSPRRERTTAPTSWVASWRS